MSITLVVK